MGKKWTKCYLLFGTILMALLSAICSLTFVKSNVQQGQDKKIFESIYVDTSIDFIVPSPSYSQVEEVEQNSETGIAALIPYYETTTAAMVEGKTAKGTIIIFPEESKVQYTPYGSSRIISGKNDIAAGSAIADRIFVEKNDCGVGDTVSLSISDFDYTFIISGVAETNTYYNDGTIAVILTEEQAKQLQDNGVKYSAAYVSAGDYEKCKSYLYTDYKPYGRLKEEASFDSKDAYNQHVQNFESADWTKEITNCKDNYSALSVKYENVGSGILMNMVIAAIIVFLAVIIFNSVLLRHEELKKFLQGYLIKKSGTKEEIKRFYRNGITFNSIAFTFVTFALYYWIASTTGAKPFSISMITSLVIMGAQIAASAIMSVLATGYIEKNYTIKKKKPETDQEHKRKTNIPQESQIKEENNKGMKPEEVKPDSPSNEENEGQRSEDAQGSNGTGETTPCDDNVEGSLKSSDGDYESDNAPQN